jgi:hypothetical protein
MGKGCFERLGFDGIPAPKDMTISPHYLRCVLRLNIYSAYQFFRQKIVGTPRPIEYVLAPPHILRSFTPDTKHVRTAVRLYRTRTLEDFRKLTHHSYYFNN